MLNGYDSCYGIGGVCRLIDVSGARLIAGVDSRVIRAAGAWLVILDFHVGSAEQ